MIRLAVFGINEDILRVIKKEIDPRKVEIVLFLDNDKAKQGSRYMGIPVSIPGEEVFVQNPVDYILVTALSAYEFVKNQLMEMGVRREQIQVFITKDLCKYCLGSIDDIDVDFVNRVYFQPGKAMELVMNYQKLYENYLQVPVFSEISDKWFSKSSLIAHACGGIANGKRMMYSNSKEAFQCAMDKGYSLLECDMLRVNDQEWVLAHDYFHFYESREENYSMMTAEEFLVLLKQYPGVYCLVDVKWEDYNEYALCVAEIDRIVTAISSDEMKKAEIKKQIIMEVYDEPTIRLAKSKGYEMIFTQYRNPDRYSCMHTVSLCYRYGIPAVAFGMDNMQYVKKFLELIIQKNIKIFIFSIDSVEEYHDLRKMGIAGVITNYLTETDIAGKEA